MRLYHGTTLTVQVPRLVNRFSTLDFGRGFYTTSNENQAREFALKTFSRRGRDGVPTVNVYEIPDECLTSGSLACLVFDGPSKDWLEFVAHNRKHGRSPDLDVDVIVGPVANDNVFRTIDMFEAGDLTVEEAIARFKVDELFDQYLFCNERSIGMLSFVEAYEVV